MNSSGIKRGLAAGAVAALAVTGLPFLASSASAAGSLSSYYVGPVRNGGDVGGVLVLGATGISAGNVNDSDAGTPGYQGKVKVIGSDLVSPVNTPSQTIEVKSATYVPAGPSGVVMAMVAATTPADGGAVSYAVYIDEDNDNLVDANEPRVQISATTAGAPATVTVEPASQNVTADEESAAFIATAKDAAGNVTQLKSTETATVTTAATTTVNFYDQTTSQNGTRVAGTVGADLSKTGAEIPFGTLKFTASDSTTTPGTIDIPIAMNGKNAVAKLNVAKTATGITAGDVDVVTGADGWSGFGGGAFGATLPVRVDQTSITLSIKDTDNKGATVVVNTSAPTGAKVNGATTAQRFTTTLDADGVGSIVIPVSDVVAGGTFTISGNGINLPVEFQRSAVKTATTDASTYVSAYGGTTTVVVTAKDQFGLPATGAYVQARRQGGANNETLASTTKKPVDANGQATFTFTDTKATAASHVTDNIKVSAFVDQFSGTAVATAADLTVAQIVYSATGAGDNFALSVDGTAAASPAYNPAGAYATIAPLTAGVEDNSAAAADGGDDVIIAVSGGTLASAATITVDNGALIVAQGGTLASGSASKTINLAGGAGSFRVVGTKTGLVTATVTSAGVTKTVQFTVKSDGAVTSARNIAVSGPAKAKANDVVTFTAVVTDAFGNPIVGLPAPTPTLTGPASVVGNSGPSNAAGQITYTVQLTNSAASAVTLSLTGTGNQFGALANRLNSAATTDNAPGLTASVATASATITDVVNIAALEQKVADAQDDVDEAQADLDAANDDLAVAKAEKKVAQAEVKAAQKDLKKAKKQKKGVAAAKKAVRAAKGQLTIANAKVASAKAKVARATADLEKAQAALAAAEQELEDAQS